MGVSLDGLAAGYSASEPTHPSGFPLVNGETIREGKSCWQNLTPFGKVRIPTRLISASFGSETIELSAQLQKRESELIAQLLPLIERSHCRMGNKDKKKRETGKAQEED